MVDDSAQIDLSINKLDDDIFELQIDMNLFGETWIVSPLAEDYPFGRTKVEFSEHNDLENNFVIFSDSIYENSLSELMTAKNFNKPYGVVNQRTELRQAFKLNSNQDFELRGQLFYILEPICTPNEILFKIVKSGDTVSIVRTDVDDY